MSKLLPNYIERGLFNLAQFLDIEKAEMSFWVITVVVEYIFAYYFLKRSLTRRDVPKSFNLAASLLFLGLAFTYTLRILNDYYELFYQNNVLMFISNIPFLLGTLPIVLYLEKNIIKKTRYIISSLLIISCGVFVVISIISNFDPSTIGFWAAVPTTIGMIVPSLSYLYIVIKSEAIVRISSIYICIGIILLAFPMIVFIGVPISPLFIPLASFIGCLFLAEGFFGYPIEIKWQDKLQEIYVISDTGICYYAYSFEKNLPLDDSDLIAGGFTGIRILLSEITRTSEPLHLIDYQNMKIMLQQTTDTVFVLIIKEESNFLQYKLRQFSQEFQSLFKDTLQHWNGNIEIFKPARSLIQRIFELKENVV